MRDPELDGACTWVGTAGVPIDGIGLAEKQEIEDKLATEYSMIPVFCSMQDIERHYAHFCKEILWPVFHYQIPDHPKSKAFQDHSWENYVNVNQAFADTILSNWKQDDVIWIHDYHLLLVPQMIRSKIAGAKILFFLHVAFPSSEVFRCLALRKELLEGMLGSNLVGFQTHEYARHFLQTCSRLLGVEATPKGVHLGDRFVNVTSSRIGIDPTTIDASRAQPDVHWWIDKISRRFEGMKIIMGRDKVDLARGARQNLLSYELFLQRHPQWWGKVVFVQIGLVSADTDLERSILEIVVRINSKMANLAYQPVVYLGQDVTKEQYLALLSVSDALMITNQREGFNLTSHEYVYCQDGMISAGKKHGALILSEFVGTASIFGKYQFSVNPWDNTECADAILQALQIDEEEKQRRWEGLYAAVTRHSGSQWYSAFLTFLDRVYDEQFRRDQANLPRLSVDELFSKYQGAKRRLLFLDFEGAIVRWGSLNEVIPTNPQRAIHALTELVVDERNTIYVMSSRRPEELDQIFRRVANVGLIAENGCFIKECGTTKWIESAALDRIKLWKDSVKSMMLYFLERVPGAEIEECRCSLIFHYDKAENYESAARTAAHLAENINEVYEEHHVRAVPQDGSFVVEPIEWNKRTAASRVFEHIVSHSNESGQCKMDVDFLTVICSGREDKEAFRWANSLGESRAVKDVLTVSVGMGNRETEAKATFAHGVSGTLISSV
jgi:trehalose 6-phosphate synthase/phosphatase